MHKIYTIPLNDQINFTDMDLTLERKKDQAQSLEMMIIYHLGLPWYYKR